MKKAESLTDPNGFSFQKRIMLRAVTYNNIGCYFRRFVIFVTDTSLIGFRRNKLNAALQYVEKAFKIETKYKEADNPAGTHLNLGMGENIFLYVATIHPLCAGAILSQLNRHDEALLHSQSALMILLDESQQMDAGLLSNSVQESHLISSLVVAYHNVAVEQEFCRKRDESLENHEKALQLAQSKLGPTHPLTIKMETAFSDAVRVCNLWNS